MRWLRVQSVIWAVCLVLAATAAEAQGQPPPETVTWILIGGGLKRLPDTAGVQLHASPDSDKTITPDLNPSLGASGMIFQGPFQDCPHLYHYHGALGGMEDNGEKCGWGQAVPSSQASDVLKHASAVTMLEMRALAKLRATPPDIPGAQQDIDASFPGLNDVESEIDNLKSSGRLKQNKATKLKRTREAAVRADNKALNALAKGNVGEAAQHLDRAIRRKQELVELLAKFEVHLQQ
jgi:hypothetical protein